MGMQKKAIEINRTNTFTAIDLLKEININLEKMTLVDKKVEYQSYMTGHKRKPDKYEGVVKRHKQHLKRFEVTSYVDTVDSFEYNWLQVAAEFESVLLLSDLPVIIRQPYIDNAKYKGSVPDEEWTHFIHSGEHNIYMDLITCLANEFPNNHTAYTAAEGLKELEHALECHKNGHFSGACINIMRAAIHLKNLERQKYEAYEHSGRAQQDSGRSANNEKRKSRYHKFFLDLQKITTEVRKEHPSKSNSSCHEIIAQRANKLFKGDLEELNLDPFTAEKVKDWIRGKNFTLESKIRK